MILLLLHSLAGCSDYDFHGKTDEPEGGGPSCVDTLPTAATVPIDEGCAFATPTGAFHPIVEWQWSQNVGAPGYDEVMMTPVVGDVDLDGLPDIVFTAYANPNYGSAGALVILAGDGSGEEAVYLDVGGYTPTGSAGIALGDLDADGIPEIVTVSTDARVLTLHADGTVLWVTDPHATAYTAYAYPSIADLDGDGYAEVIVGRAIFAHDGTLLGEGAYGWGGAYGLSVVQDLDGDGVQEVVSGNAAYHADGSAVWTNATVPDGYPAVGDFDGDGQGEVATVVGGGVYLLDTDGTLLWGPAAVPGGVGGPPTIADFDGDGLPEIGVAGYAGYAVFDTNGAMLWSQATQDASSAQTGSSVFDFEGDGASEAIYADELVLRVYDGATGTVKLSDDGHSSWTLFEYPIVADVDGDDEAEIILASNDSINGGWKGITVIGDADGSWAPTARVWNQHGYAITNVNDDLSIPAFPTPNWEVGHNSFRAGGLRDRTGNPAPDLAATIVDVCWDCDATDVRVIVQVQNTGPLDVYSAVDIGVSVRAGRSEVLVASARLPDGLRGGTVSVGVEIAVPADRLTGATELVATVDPANVIPECDEGNGETTTLLETCE